MARCPFCRRCSSTVTGKIVLTGNFCCLDAENNRMSRTFDYATAWTKALVDRACNNAVLDGQEKKALLVFASDNANVDWRKGKDSRHGYDEKRDKCAPLLF